MDFRLPVSATRFLIVHYHIFKNGGSTITSILEREFRNAFATVHGPDDVSVVDEATFGIEHDAALPGTAGWRGEPKEIGVIAGAHRGRGDEIFRRAPAYGV